MSLRSNSILSSPLTSRKTHHLTRIGPPQRRGDRLKVPGYYKDMDSMNMQMIEDKVLRIIVADDQWEVCSALQLLLSHETSTLIVGQAQSAQELLTCLEQTSPDMVLLDWELPGLDTPRARAQSSPDKVPLVTIANLQRQFPGVKFVALSCRLEARSEAMAGKLDAFISKVDPPEIVLKTINSLE
jgi:CheY-like chemotaxis protein